jgi:hypothetical protein
MILSYVYLLIDPRNDLPFYVGKGVRSRWRVHEKAALRGKDHGNRHLYRKIREIQRLGFNIIYEKWLDSDDPYLCFWMEVYLIAYFGRENLCNLTDGGEGIVDSTGEIGKKLKATIQSSARFQAALAQNKQKMLAWRKENPEEFAAYACANIAKANEDMKADPAKRAEIQRLAKLTYDTPEYRAERSSLSIEQMSDPAQREALRLAQTERFKDPAEREAARVRGAEIWERPGYREVMREILKIAFSNPAYRKLRSSLSKQQYIDNPALCEQQGERQEQWWRENYDRGCAIQKEVQNRPEIIAEKQVVMTRRMNSERGEQMKAKTRATKSDPEWRKLNRIRMRAARDNNPAWTEKSIDNIKAGLQIMRANAARRHEVILEQLLFIITPEGLRYGPIMQIMKERFGVLEDVGATVLRLALKRGLLYKEPGKMGAYRRDFKLLHPQPTL